VEDRVLRALGPHERVLLPPLSRMHPSITLRLEDESPTPAARPDEPVEVRRTLAPRGPRFYATQAIIATVAAAWLYQLVVGGDDENILVTIHLGSNLPALVAAGEIDRLVTANWLHGGWVHIGMNLVTLFLLGRLVEHLLGAPRFVFVYLVSCLAGSAASFLAMRDIPSLGASTGVVGVFASLGYVLFAFRKTLPAGLRPLIAQWVLMLLLNAGFWVSFPSVGIDHFGHAGGFVGGVVATALTTFGWRPLEESRLGKRIAIGLTALLSIAIAAGLSISVIRALGPRDDARILGAVEHRIEDPALLNLYAWFVAIEPETTRETLAIARRMSERSLAAHDRIVVSGDGEREGWRLALASYRDTLATIDYRLGDLDGAIAMERTALPGVDGDSLTQLARFLKTRLDREGPIALPAAAPPSLAVELSGESVLAFDAEGVYDQGLEFFVLVEADGSLVKLVHARLGAGRALPADQRLSAPLPRGSTVRLALVDAAAAVPASTSFTVTIHELDAEILSYPGPLSR
jgi:membrane associated rhomboid family serine protease